MREKKKVLTNYRKSYQQVWQVTLLMYLPGSNGIWRVPILVPDGGCMAGVMSAL